MKMKREDNFSIIIIDEEITCAKEIIIPCFDHPQQQKTVALTSNFQLC